MAKTTATPGRNARNTMLLWNPGTDQVTLMPLGEDDRRYESSSLAAYAPVREMSFEERKTFAFVTAMHLIIRDKVDPMALHQALLGLPEYRDGCADDMPGLVRHEE